LILSGVFTPILKSGFGAVERINLKNYFLINIIPIWKNDMPLALKMFKAGKLKLFPTFGKPKAKKRAAEGLQ
jgi:hypothetical protein